MTRLQEPNPGTPARVHVRVSGIVQGVFFRDFTRRSAVSLGLNGWVRNLSDGRVEAVAEGEKDRLLDWLELLKQGPRSSRVDALDAAWEPPEGGLKDFEVRY